MKTKKNMRNQNTIPTDDKYVGNLSPEARKAYHEALAKGRLVGHFVSSILVEQDKNEKLNEHNSLLEFEANHDELTGLLNKRGFKKFLESKNLDGCIFLYVDGTNVKRINDEYNHTIGNDVIVGMGDVLKGSIRKNDRVARIGGDEFAVYIDPTQRYEEEYSAEERLELLKNGIDERTKLLVEKNKPIFNSFDIAVGGSIGRPDSTIESLKLAADIDMRVQKNEQHELLGAYRQT